MVTDNLIRDMYNKNKLLFSILSKPKNFAKKSKEGEYTEAANITASTTQDGRLQMQPQPSLFH